MNIGKKPINPESEDRVKTSRKEEERGETESVELTGYNKPQSQEKNQQKQNSQNQKIQNKGSQNMQELDVDNQVHPFASPFLWILSGRCRSSALYILLVIVLLTVLASLIHPVHGHVPGTGWLGFFAVYGFIAFSFVVLAGWPLGKLLRRKENYYKEDEEE